ncbi:TonB-dependent receptor [uncultured Polaribacter sp.]|uniref:SusC/RagA family TonB-linked outer membrane protein n=1 Tax=uncultured Polaribacter sp. TaxID=174711 RepID=UPI0026254B25|nr:TonB-dependent receptor [uncultured Polaribacter sp.]
MEKLKFLLILSLIGFIGTSWTQNSVSGVVTDDQNNPTPGVTVNIKGTSIGTITDFDGNYQIKVNNGNIIVFSYLGYKTQEVTYLGQSSINIQLKEDISQLDEVVIIGYGAVKRTDLTGAVASLSAEEITEQKKTDIGQALQGRVAGVDIRSLSNKPGAPLSFDIRGNTAIKPDNYAGRDGISDALSDDESQPLFVVDGVFFDDINVLNPSDIQQIDILKDVSATAIYGSRGANGVVIITTKNGIEGRTRFTYDATFGIREATNKPDMFNGAEYVQFVEDVMRSTAWKGLFDPAAGIYPTVEDYNNLEIDISQEIRSTNEEADNMVNGRYTDWAKDYRQVAIQTSHNLGMSGGSNGLVYNGTLGYLKDEGVMGIEQFERYNISLSLTKKITDKFTVGLKSYLALAEREEGSRELFRSSLRLAPTVNSRDPEGNIILFPDDQDGRFTNPFYDANGAWRVNTKSFNVIANVFLSYQFADWVNFKTQFAPSINNSRFGEYRGLLTKDARNEPERIRSIYNTTFRTSYTWDNIADFNFNIFEGHQLNATLVSSLYYNQAEGSAIETRDFDTDAYLFYNTSAGLDVRNNDSRFSKVTLASFTGRLNYNIQNKYLFTATGRYDGSSKLALGNKWAFFPSAAIAWKASEEEFLKNVSWLNNLKFRITYGEAGNDSSASPYQSLALITGADYLFGDEITNGIQITGLNNADLAWERSKEFNFGLDAGVFDNRVRLAFEIYNKNTEGSIFDRELSRITGFANGAVGNYGSVKNSGFEITLNTTNILTDDFKWVTSLNFSRNKNEILRLDGERDEEPFGNHGRLIVGEAVDAIYGYEKIGIWQLEEAAEALSYGYFPGEEKYRDQNSDGILNADDQVVIGQVSPDWTGGMTNTFSYKNFDFSFQIYTRQGSFGHSEFYNNFVPWQNDDAKFNKLDLDYWTPNNPNSQNPALEYGATGNNYYTEFDFVRVGNIGLGYQFPQTLLEKFKMSSFRLTLDIQNPFTFTDYAGPDPETGLQNSYNSGYLLKTVLFGIKISL